MINALGLLLVALDTLLQYARRGAGGVVPGDLQRMLSDLLSKIRALGDGRGCGCPLTENEECEIISGYSYIRRAIDDANRARDGLLDNSALSMACNCMFRMRETVLAAQSRLDSRDA